MSDEDMRPDMRPDSVRNKIRISNLERQVKELGDALQKSGVKWDFRLDEQRGDINELKKRLGKE